jgi:hypothetical protein
MRPEEIERFFTARVVGPEALAMAVHLRTTDRLIGTCAFSQLDADNGSALYHITIGESDAWGKGYGTEATQLMLDHAFGAMGLHRIALFVFEFNERAVRAYKRCGFVSRVARASPSGATAAGGTAGHERAGVRLAEAAAAAEAGAGAPAKQTKGRPASRSCRCRRAPGRRARPTGCAGHRAAAMTTETVAPTPPVPRCEPVTRATGRQRPGVVAGWRRPLPPATWNERHRCTVPADSRRP